MGHGHDGGSGGDGGGDAEVKKLRKETEELKKALNESKKRKAGDKLFVAAA